MIKDFLQLGEKNLKKRKLRSWLTIIGIFIAIATIFTLVSLSFGLQNAVDEQFRQIGTDKFFIMPKTGMSSFGSEGVIALNETDYNVIKKVAGVKGVAYMSAGNVKLEYSGKPRFYLAIGLPCDDPIVMKVIIESMNIKLYSGVFLAKGDTKKIAVGYAYLGNQFDKPAEVGTKLTVNDVNYKIKGILETVGNSADDKQVYICFEDFKELFNRTTYDYIYVQTLPDEDINKVAEETEKQLRKSRGVTEKTQDFMISTPEELLDSFKNILNIIFVFLLGIAAISLLVGGIGIANTMYTSVLERTKEIGIMKSIGAKNSDIVYIFVIESGLLGLIGGILGIILGMIIGKSIEFIALNALGTNLLKVVFPVWLILSCLAFAFLVGVLSGLFPALRGAKIHPTEALRYE
jgi:putative ABC transport system permease protein